jgi:hypothetical protein
MENVNSMLRGLDRSGVSDLVYTTVRDFQTGQTRYIDGDGNQVSQAAFEAQRTARQALGQISEVTAEEILRELSDDGNQHPAGNATDDNAKERFEVESNNGKDDENNTDAESDAPQTTGKKHGPPAPPDATPNKRAKQSGKTPISSTTRPIPQSGHRGKRWSEIKSWKEIIEADARGECPDDIDDLVQDAEQVAGKSLKGKYLATVEKLKVVGYDSKAAELESTKEEILQLHKQLDEAKADVKKAKDQIKKIKQKTDESAEKSTPKSAGKKKSAPGKEKPTPPSATQLSLPPPPASRATMTVPMSAMASTAFADTIIDAGVSMMRATDEDDWPDRARNWVALAESRPHLEYK